ncbi:MAG TPA: dihydrolipoamide acetyltransferase family protein [Tepidisphaeraceae bacterium]|nr:dihydrolipoamide acetyltransferase family protein [Tepidisphaeraceae bacterium]
MLPQVELTMESAIIAKWLVAVGDRVAAEQPLLEVETQKATTDVPSPAAGYVRQLCAKEGETVAEKALLCVLTDSADEPLGGEGEAAPAKASPAARRLAKELGIDLLAIRGTGRDGRITEQDVRTASGPRPAPAPTAGDAPSEWVTLPATRLALIAQMRKSLSEIPQIHLQRRLDVTPLSVKTHGITFTHRLIVAAARALREHPAIRTSINGERIRIQPVSVAIAIDSAHGLVAPILRDADQLSLEQVAAAVTNLRERAQANSLRREELTADAPFAITNLGMLEVDQFDAFVFYRQTAVLSVGRSTDVSGRQLAWIGLAVDHRVVDGAQAARFLQTLQSEILKP